MGDDYDNDNETASYQPQGDEQNPLVGGRGDYIPYSNFDAHEMSLGVKVEMEHTHDRNVARDIARDHLSEDPHYYSKLIAAGFADEVQESVINDLNTLAKQSAQALPQKKKNKVMLDLAVVS